MCNDSSNIDGCPQGEMFNYVTGSCLPCSGGVAVANQQSAGTHSNTGDNIIKYANAGAGIFTQIWGAVKGNKSGGSNGAYGGGAPTVEESGMKYVWYIMAAIILIVLGTFIFKLIKK